MNTRVMELFKLFKSFFIWKIVIIEFICIQAMMNVSYANNNFAEFHALEECSLLPEIGDIGDRLGTILTKDSFELVKIYLEITGDAGPYKRGTLGPMLHPGSWVLTRGRTGRMMLLLKENSEEMSLGYLSLGVTKLNITVMQRPEQCLSRLTDLQAEKIVSKAILTGFVNRSVALYYGAEVCSRYFNVPQTGSAKLVYKCCRLSHSNTLDCYDLKAPAWQSFLIASIVVAVLIFSSKFIPRSLVKFQSELDNYHFNPLSGNRLYIRLLKVENEKPIGFGRFVRIKDPSLVYPDSDFQRRINELMPKPPMEISVEKVVLSLRPKELLQDGQSPASVLSFLWHFFFRCKLRSEFEEFCYCCDEKVFSKIRWYDFLRMVMYIIFIGLLCTPWIIRLCFYYKYELKIEEQLQHAFASRNLPYTGSLASYLPPNHPLFIGIYVILAIQLLRLICQCVLKKKLNLIVQTCMFDVESVNVLDACAALAYFAVVPLRFLGIAGCLVLPLWAPFIAFKFILFLLQFFPIVNLSLRLLFHFIFYLIVTMFPSMLKYKTVLNNYLDIIIVEHQNIKSRKNNFIYALELLSTLMIILCLTTLVTECIYFYLEASAYMLIGIILNQSNAMSSISSVLWSIVYFYECFTPTHFAYSTFCKTIHSEIRDKIDQNYIERVFSHDEQLNRAFQVQSTINMERAERMNLVCGSNGVLQWDAPRVCLFLNRYHKPYIPKKMLFVLAKTIDHSSCPKQLPIMYFNSLIDFIKIVVFVYFYFVVISAFGHEIAVFAIGSVPLIIRKFLTKAHEQLTVENNIAWKKALRRALESYRQNWAVGQISTVGNEQVETIQGNQPMHPMNAIDTDLLVVQKTKIGGSTYYEYFASVLDKETYTVKKNLYLKRL